MYRSIVGASLLSALSFVAADPIVQERAAISQTLVYPQPTQSCVAGVHMILARGTLEPQGPGFLKGVADDVVSMVPGSDYVSVVYPATFDYFQSEQEGVVAMKLLVNDYVDKCPGHWISLFGYSQGAQVVGDTVIGSDNKGFSSSSTNPIGLGKQYLSQISSLIQMGDPGFTPGTPGHVGNASMNGTFPRINIDAYKQYGFADKMQNYCDANDTYCSGGSNLGVHVGYVAEYGKAAASFVASQFTVANGGGSGAVATSAGSSSSGGSGSSQAPKSTSAAATSSKPASSAASSAARTSAASSGGAATSAKSSSSAQKITTGIAATATGDVLVALTSDAYKPTTTSFTGRFTQLANIVPTGGAVPAANVEKSVAGAVFGAAMFAMGFM